MKESEFLECKKLSGPPPYVTLKSLKNVFFRFRPAVELAFGEEKNVG